MDALATPPPDPGTSEPSTGPAPRRPRLLAVVLGIVAAAAVAVGAAVVVLMGLLQGSADVADRMVPGDIGVYATAYLNPSLSQKLDLRALLQHFPALHGQQLDGRVDQAMDTLLRPEGLSFARDVRPWLGSQVSLAVRLGTGASSAVIVASTDDARAAAALARIRSTPTGSADRWSEHARGGVTVSVGAPAGGRGTSLAYAYLDHAAVLGTSAGIVDAIVDTDQGRRPALRASTPYTAVVQRLPRERVGLVYASGPALAGAFRQLTSAGLADAGLLSAVEHGADAVRSAGVALSAQHGGIAADLAVVTDTSRLSPAARRALQATASANPALDWVPTDAAAVLAAGGLRDSIHALAQGMGAAAPATTAGLPVLPGLPIDPREALSHLDGNLALEVRAIPRSVPGGALIAGVDDEQAVRTLLARLTSALAGVAWPRTETYRGTTITSLPALGDGLAPAEAVLDGVAVLGSSPAEVRAVIDAHDGGRRVVATPGFTAGGAYSTGSPVLYVDLDRVRAAVEASLPAGGRQAYDRDVRSQVTPLHSLRVTRQGSGADATVRVFLAAG
jgi:Protein of unknown function (DUF3352)